MKCSSSEIVTERMTNSTCERDSVSSKLLAGDGESYRFVPKATELANKAIFCRFKMRHFVLMQMHCVP
jgi:hypothetical protein